MNQENKPSKKAHIVILWLSLYNALRSAKIIPKVFSWFVYLFSNRLETTANANQIIKGMTNDKVIWVVLNLTQ